MTAQQRKRLCVALEHLEKASEIVNDIWEKEQQKFYNLSENLQATAANKKLETNVEILEAMCDSFADNKQDLYVLADL